MFDLVEGANSSRYGRGKVVPLAAVLLLGAALCACRSIELPDLTNIIPAERTIADNFPKLLDRSDYVEISDIHGETITATIDNGPINSAPPTDCTNRWPAAWTADRYFQGPWIRIPLALMEKTKAITVKSGKDGFPTKIELCVDGKPKLDFSGHVSISDVENLFPSGVAATIVRDPPRRAFPGDEMVITAHWQASFDDAGSRPFGFAQSRTIVRSDGRMILPLLNSPGNIAQSDPSESIRIKDRRWNARYDAGSSLVQVWYPERSYAAQPLLQHIEGCLAAGKSMPVPDGRSNKPPTPLCVADKLDGSVFLPDPHETRQRRVRYQIEPVQWWMIVYADGSLEKVSFRPREKLKEAVARQHRLRFGRTLVDSDPLSVNLTYLTVIPRRELGGNLALPFWLKFEAGSNAESRDVMLFPGDVVHVTHLKPRSR